MPRNYAAIGGPLQIDMKVNLSVTLDNGDVRPIVLGVFSLPSAVYHHRDDASRMSKILFRSEKGNSRAD